jgi:ComF family protein
LNANATPTAAFFGREHGMNGKLAQYARRGVMAVSAHGALRGVLRGGGATLLRALLPASCALCGELHGDAGDAGDELLCAGCAAQFFGSERDAPPRCPCCANPLPGAATESPGGAAASPTNAGSPLVAAGLPLAAGSSRAAGSSLDAATGSPAAAGSPLAAATGLPLGAATGLPAAGSQPDDDLAVRCAPASQLCGACRVHPPAFDVTLVAADYALPIDQLVLQLKFGHRLALAALFARLLRDAVLLRPGFVLPALLCPVPLGPRRLAERGYNQPLEIARPLARGLGVALHPRLVSRVRETAAQSTVAPELRQQNIAGAFAIPDPALVQGRHIGVVDDVMTSGRTLNELAATLKRHGAARVSNLVFARTPPH